MELQRKSIGINELQIGNQLLQMRNALEVGDLVRDELPTVEQSILAWVYGDSAEGEWAAQEAPRGGLVPLPKYPGCGRTPFYRSTFLHDNCFFESNGQGPGM